MDPLAQVKRFATNNLLISAALDAVEENHQIKLRDRPSQVQVIDETYYPQFDERFRREAADMAVNFRIFYCLENSIRELISESLEERYGANWWSEAMSPAIKSAAEGLRQKETDMGA